MTSPFGFTSKTDLIDDVLASHMNGVQLAADVLAKSHDGTLFNGKISVSVASNDITVAIKTLDGADPSASDPVYVSINGTIRSLTTGLSVTKNDGTNWFGAGGTKFATQEIDYFVYLIWDTIPATDELDIGFARIPYGQQTSDFNATSTNEMYIATSNGSALSTNNFCVNIGRFNAILSATAAFNWSLPGTTVVIQRPIFRTRRLTWVPSTTGYSVDPTNTAYEYEIDDNICKCWVRETTNGTSNATSLLLTAPFTASTVTNGAWIGLAAGVDNGAALATPVRISVGSGASSLTFFPTMSAAATWTNVNGKRIVNGYVEYPID